MGERRCRSCGQKHDKDDDDQDCSSMLTGGFLTCCTVLAGLVLIIMVLRSCGCTFGVFGI